MVITAPASPVSTRGSDFAHLSRVVAQAGLMRRRYGYYAMKILVTDSILIGGWVCFALLGDSWWQLLIAALLGIAFTQVGFLGHDAGHRQIFRTRRASELAGLLHGNLAIGLSYGWWIDKHSRHHANPNHDEHDPDVGSGALVWSAEQTRNRRGFGRVLARWQAYLFFPMLLLEGLNLHVSSVRAIVGGAPMRRRGWEAALLGAHVVGYLTAVALVLSPGRAIAFIAVQQGLFGLYMGCAFAPNHKGMPMVSDSDNLDFLRKQVLTSRNVHGGWLIDLFLGGLNYQIEHHLFPSMPRANLRRAAPLVRDYCASVGVPYESTNLFASYGRGLRHLHTVGRK